MTKHSYLTLIFTVCTIFMSLINPPGSHQWNFHSQVKWLSVSFQCLFAVTNPSACLQDPFWRKPGKFLSPDKTQLCLHGWISTGTAQTHRQVCTRFFSCCRELSYAFNKSRILTNSLGTSCRRHNLKCHLIRAQMQKAVISGSLQEVSTIKIP